jgi:hypothetical protein
VAAALAAAALAAVALAACTGGGSDDRADGATGGATSTGGTTPGGTSGVTSAATAPVVVTEVVTVTQGVGDDVSNDGIDIPWNANTDPDTQDGSGDPVLLTGFRVGRHEGFDRVVWEFAGGGAPGWSAEYVDNPSRDPSGEPVDLPGDATISVRITGVGIPGDVPVDAGVTPYGGTGPVTLDGAVVTAAEAGGVFEGTVDGFVGVRDKVPFRVYLLESPTRVVLEVRE